MDERTAVFCGQRAEVTTGEHAGKQGRVNYVNAQSDRVGIVPFDSWITLVFPRREIRVLGQEEA